MVTDDGYTCDEHNATYRLYMLESLCRTPETDVTLQANFTSITKKKIT